MDDISKIKEVGDRLIRQVIEDSPALRSIFMTRMPRYRYWETKGRIRWMFGWTVERNTDGKFEAFIYKFEKAKNQYRLAKRMPFSRRHKAKERAKKWYEKKATASRGEPAPWRVNLLSTKYAIHYLDLFFPWMIGE